jgi:hypothetical protein
MGVQINGSEGNVIATKGTYSGNVTIGGTLTYEDVTNIDSVGLVTARTGIEIGARPGVAASISIDGNAIFSGITTIATLRATTGIVTAFQGDVVIEDKIIHSGDTNTAIRFPSADTITAETGGSESFRVDSSQRLLLGHTSSQTIGSNSHPLVQFNVNSNQAALSLARFENVSAGPSLNLGKSRGSSAGSYTVVQSGDGLGSISFAGADGTDLVTTGAVIAAQVDGTPGSNDMPGRIVFKTTADGASSPTERLRITSDGKAIFTTPGGDDAVLIKGDTYTSVRVQSARDDASDHAMFQMLASRGTNASPSIVQSGDILGTLTARGYDGNSFAQSANITFEVDATPGDGDMPGRITFSTAADGAESPTERMRIQENGYINIGSGTAEEQLTIRNTTQHCLLRLISNNGSTAGIDFGDPEDTDIGRIRYYHNDGSNTNYMTFFVNGSEKLRIDSTGHILNLNDSARLKLGAGQDLEIYHDGTSSGLHNATGDLYIENDNSSTSEKIYIRAKAGENGITLNPNGSVELYHDGASDSSLYTRYDGLTIRNNNAETGKDCNVDLVGQVDGGAQLHFYADNATDNNKKWQIKGGNDERMDFNSYYTGGWDFHMRLSKGAFNTSDRKVQIGKGGLRFDMTCEDYRDIDGDGHLFRREGQAQIGVDDFLYFHDISTSENNLRMRQRFNTTNGNIDAEGSINANQSLDFAEYFEWSDGNPSNEDRIGHTVSADGLTGKIKIAEEGETVIGVISGTAGYIGGGQAFSWQGRFKHDEWGREVFEEQKDENGNLIYADAETRAQIVKTERIETEEYDPSLENSYVPRELRKEWDVVGLVGQIRVRKTAVIPSNWVKLKEIDSVKDLYLVR